MHLFFISMLLLYSLGFEPITFMLLMQCLSNRAKEYGCDVVIYPAAQQKNKSLFYHLFILF